MQMKSRKKLSSFILCIVLIVAMALSTTGCNDSTRNHTLSGSGTEVTVQTNDPIQTNDTVLGEGNKKFTFIVTDKESSETQFEIHTDSETVGEALMELGLIEGEVSTFGLYVKTVNGITVDYDKDGVYWAFYINDEYALTGVDATTITEGEIYSFKVE